MTLELDADLQAELAHVIRENFPAGTVESVTFAPAFVDDDGPTVEILIYLADNSEPEKVAKHYFGLTRKVRDKLRGPWQEFFPLLKPVFSESTHA